MANNMRPACGALLLLALAGLASASLELRTVQEDSQPGESSGTYAILENGKLVGMVQRYSASGAPLRRQMGRRAGPSDDVLPPHAERLANRVKARMDLVGAIHDQLLATGCPFARQMALARMQAAAAAQGLVPGDGDELALPGAKLFGEPEPEDGEAEHPPVGDSRGPHMMMMMRGQDEVEEQEAGPGPWATREEREAFLKAHPAFPRPGMMREPDFDDALPDPAEHPAFPRPLMWREADAAEAGQGPAFDPLAHPAFPRPLIMRDGSEREWRSLANTAMPVPGLEPEVNWRVRDEAGNLNWGLITFGVLSGACAAVWGAMLVQYFAYCSARAQCTGRACFIFRAGSGGEGPLKPLLHEGHLEELDSPKGSLKEGVEYAAAHVPAATRNVTILHYEALPASQQ